MAEHPQHLQRCWHAACPCYLDGLRAGTKPTGKSLLGALEDVLMDSSAVGGHSSGIHERCNPDDCDQAPSAGSREDAGTYWTNQRYEDAAYRALTAPLPTPHDLCPVCGYQHDPEHFCVAPPLRDCDVTWPLVNPSPEDIATRAMHQCRLPMGHVGAHRCAKDGDELPIEGGDE